MQKALRIESRLEKVDNPADTHLNMCAVLSQLGRHAGTFVFFFKQKMIFLSLFLFFVFSILISLPNQNIFIIYIKLCSLDPSFF